MEGEEILFLMKEKLADVQQTTEKEGGLVVK